MDDKKNRRLTFAKPNYSLKDKIIAAVLTSFSISFMFIPCGMVEVYSNNALEFGFAFSDIAGLILFAFVLAFALLFLFCILMYQKFLPATSSALFSAVFGCYAFNVFFSKTSFVSGDVVGDDDSFASSIVFLICFIVIFSVLFIIALKMSERWKGVIIFMSVLIIGMNASALISNFVKNDVIHIKPEKCEYVLTDKDMFTVSDKENIIYILFDRFDTEFYDEVVKDSPEFFDELDGFTYYNNTVSQYSRTFPAVTSLITAVDYDASVTPSEYFENAYTNSPFLKDLKSNGYNINLYCHKYYTYGDAKYIKQYADNAQKVKGYKLDKIKVLDCFLEFSFARYFSPYLSEVIYRYATGGLYTKMYSPVSDNKAYWPYDPDVNKALNENGLSANGNDKQFVFIYLEGSHSPYFLDENCEISDNATSLTQTKGSFTIVKYYLNELKRLGVYDNSTIIITGDHGKPESDYYNYLQACTDGVTTAMFVKPRNADFKSYVTSSAPVSLKNISATIISDAHMDTEYDYGKSVFDIAENDNIQRNVWQSIYDKSSRNLIFCKLSVNGDARNIENWTVVENTDTKQKWY